MSNIMKIFTAMLLMQLFFSFAITIYVNSLPAATLDYVSSFSDVGERIDFDDAAESIESNLQEQQNMPLVEVGALVFYSGNILIDLLLNFAFAIPEMIGLIIYGLTRIFNLPVVIVAIIESFIGVVILVLYFLSVIQLLTNIRSGRVV